MTKQYWFRLLDRTLLLSAAKLMWKCRQCITLFPKGSLMLPWTCPTLPLKTYACVVNIAHPSSLFLSIFICRPASQSRSTWTQMFIPIHSHGNNIPNHGKMQFPFPYPRPILKSPWMLLISCLPPRIVSEFKVILENSEMN